MAIIIECQCGRTLRARDELAGRWVRCPNCRQGVLVPLPDDEPQERGAIELADEEPVRPPPAPLPPPRWRPPSAAADAPAPLAPPPAQVKQAESSWRGHIYWVLLLAMIPLALNVLLVRETPEERFERTLKDHPQLRQQIEAASDDESVVVNTSAGTGAGGPRVRHRITMNDVEAALPRLPGNRLEGALFSRGTFGHWLFALVAAGVFLAIVTFALPEFPARPLHLTLAGLFTGTAGVLLLLSIQVAGMFCICCIGAMYMAALDPSAPFGPSLLGFFFGVGFFEELIKALPVLWLLYRYENVGWREACLWGMASGAGFGISEGVHYSSNYYNGIEPADIYFVRFLSCVAFHTVLSGACAILLQRKQHLLKEGKDYFDWLMNFMVIVSIPILLHGLFDTLAKKEYEGLALLVAFAAFAWLAWLIHGAREGEKIKPPKAGFAVLQRSDKGTRFIAPQ
jgi:RsiW-degrading membrane proteinase PrsW (M82 family)